MYRYIRLCICSHTRTHTPIHAHIHVCRCKYKYTHIHSHTCIYKCKSIRELTCESLFPKGGALYRKPHFNLNQNTGRNRTTMNSEKSPHVYIYVHAICTCKTYVNVNIYMRSFMILNWFTSLIGNLVVARGLKQTTTPGLHQGDLAKVLVHAASMMWGLTPPSLGPLKFTKPRAPSQQPLWISRGRGRLNVVWVSLVQPPLLYLEFGGTYGDSTCCLRCAALQLECHANDTRVAPASPIQARLPEQHCTLHEQCQARDL